jgi:acetyl esterase/lipase
MKKTVIAVLIFANYSCLFSQAGNTPDSFLNSIKLEADVVYGRKYGMALTFDVIRPSKSNGAAVVFINSGGFVSGKIRYIDTDSTLQNLYLGKDELMIFPERFKYPPLAQFSIDELLQKGFTVFDVRQGGDPKFRIDEICSDCRLAIGFIKEHATHFGIDAGRIGVFGASSGGYLASFLGTDTLGIRSAVVFYPVGYDIPRIRRDFPDVFKEFKCFAVDTAILEKLSVKNRITSSSAEFLIIYGKDDYPFVTRDSEEQAAGLKKAGVRCNIISLEGTGHEFRGSEGYNVRYGDFARLSMIEWFESTLLK